MHNTKDNNCPLTAREIAILEDSQYFVNRAVDGLNLQRGRLVNYDFSIRDDPWNFLTDVYFYITALKRLRQPILVGRKVAKIKVKVENAINNFDNEITNARNMRDILEHVDEYIQNKGRNKQIRNATLYNVIYTESGIHWANMTFDIYQTQEAAYQLYTSYRRILKKEFKLYRESKSKKLT
ncbi:hypothetical protein [Tunicatimonas pelagia]|uniref:hypothetical protein n=1 Tax=Tunicatimonas pelagia TaxID=931531 RepID=UPI002666D09B|nr:hypothetical protein [Tunicatimonas pelagia]WKN45029.1 hypothetical protein P0M28_08635 [Tunicatimonas pelagia]